jgi:hypothetical protein
MILISVPSKQIDHALLGALVGVPHDYEEGATCLVIENARPTSPPQIERLTR